MRRIIKSFFGLLSIGTIIFCIVTIARILKVVNICTLAAFANVLLLGIILIVLNIAFLSSLLVNCN